MLVVGVDENGLGPRLGPLVATAAVLSVGKYDRPRLAKRAGAAGIGDSKKTSGFGNMAVAESLALAISEQEHGRTPRNVDELLDALLVDGHHARLSPCPDDATARQCFSADLPLPRYQGDVGRGRAMLRSLESRRGPKVVRVRSALACVGELNRAVLGGRTKVQVDLALFERLLMDAAGAHGSELEAYCGMVAGIRDYPSYGAHHPPEAWTEEARRKGLRAYRLRGVGNVRFEVGADDRHLPVSIASMVGKYVRELTMERIVRFHREHDPGLPAASGYHDPVTTRFIAGARPRLPIVGVAESCFIRNG